ncbi:hypothetical protein GCM10025868_14570 [Angustibacter aerolatus]|uniref:Uncharacterized protein n=1 Tax=Angustibacter aerolatus TaxID=1162965 RepID=A0ABQ6JH28_9ACTN|nr:hypothetical protein GCM10025868_14570 [Angustibacter aerolatus]
MLGIILNKAPAQRRDDYAYYSANGATPSRRRPFGRRRPRPPRRGRRPSGQRRPEMQTAGRR